MPQREIEDLTSTECFALLVEQVVGRIVFADDDGPGAVPVNYGVAGDEVVFRVDVGHHDNETVVLPFPETWQHG